MSWETGDYCSEFLAFLMTDETGSDSSRGCEVPSSSFYSILSSSSFSCSCDSPPIPPLLPLSLSLLLFLLLLLLFLLLLYSPRLPLVLDDGDHVEVLEEGEHVEADELPVHVDLRAEGRTSHTDYLLDAEKVWSDLVVKLYSYLP